MQETSQDELVSIFKDVSRRLLSEPEKCGFLVFRPRKSDRTKRSRIQEPEGKFILSRVLWEKGIDFGLEWPTIGSYDFSGPNRGTARTDLVIRPRLNRAGQINVEFKEGWSVSEAGSKAVGRIQKDFEKMLREPVSGCAFYHILQGPTRKTLSDLLSRYLADCKTGVERVEKKDKIIEKWCLVFFFLRDKEECYWRVFEKVSEVSSSEPGLNGFEHMNLHRNLSKPGSS
jgi:hypothetical protein